MSLSDLDDSEVLKIAAPMMDSLMDASTHLDYERHVHDFSESAKASLDKAQFLRICKNYQQERGYFAERELLGIIRRPGSVVVVWKQRFTKAQGEYLAELLLADHDGHLVIERVMVL